MSELKVIDVFGGGEDVVIARDAEDARAIMLEMVTEEDLHDAEFVIHPDEEPFAYREEEDGPPVTKTCAEWAAAKGRGFFSTNCA